MPSDSRHLNTGCRIPSMENGYVDQPCVVVNADGSWTCVVTTGSGYEGQRGQHIASTISHDHGRSWSDLTPIEPPTGPEASWAQPLLLPATGRIYVFYTYNKDNRRDVRTIDGSMITRVDSLGSYAYRYSDDRGQTWSPRRYEIPMRRFQIDRHNTYGGEVLFFWGVAKPFIHAGEAVVPSTKVAGFGRGFFVQNEGVLFVSPNLLTEPDPVKHVWETRPDGDVGVRTPDGGGPIAGEFKVTPLNDGSFYATYRTIDGYACHAYSHDRGRSWQRDWMRYTPAGQKVKNPRSANFSWRCGNGKYLYWFNNHGGEPLARQLQHAPELGYECRNPAWLCGGVERDGHIHWSQPEIIFYHEQIGLRWSYPDLIEQDGRYFLTETEKSTARVHELDTTMLQALWRQGEERSVARRGMVVEHGAGPGELTMPTLPTLLGHDAARLDPETGATVANSGDHLPAAGGFSIEFWLTFDQLTAGQLLFDSRDDEGRGITVTTTDNGTLRLSLCGRVSGAPGGRWSAGLCQCAWDCDPGVLEVARKHHVVFIVDGGPKLITVLVDGRLCDGADARQFGWGRFHPSLKEANGAPKARVAPAMYGEIELLRIYDRYLRTSEAVANYHAGSVRLGVSRDRHNSAAPDQPHNGR